MSITTLAMIFFAVVFVTSLIAWIWLRMRHTKESGNMGDDSLREQDQNRRRDNHRD